MAHLNGEVFHWNKLKMIRVNCPLCGSGRSSVYERYGDELQYTLARCCSCDFIFQNPRFEYNDEFLRWAYSWYGEDFIRDAKNLDPRTLAVGSEGYFAYKKSIIDGLCGVRPYRLLDVGCACGQFLSFCHGKDCVATGVETSGQQVDFIKKHLPFDAIYGTTATLLPERKGHFDVTHIAHTLEHVPDPLRTLGELVALTRPGGLVFVEVPNVVSFQNYRNHLLSKYGLRKNRWKSDNFPEHLLEFTPRTLKALMKRAGLEPVFFQTHSKKMLDRGGPVRNGLDRLINRVLPISNNMICVARTPV